VLKMLGKMSFGREDKKYAITFFRISYFQCVTYI
jgi:hypothetical protein